MSSVAPKPLTFGGRVSLLVRISPPSKRTQTDPRRFPFSLYRSFWRSAILPCSPSAGRCAHDDFHAHLVCSPIHDRGRDSPSLCPGMSNALAPCPETSPPNKVFRSALPSSTPSATTFTHRQRAAVSRGASSGRQRITILGIFYLWISYRP